jgi:hypothetical protein
MRPQVGLAGVILFVMCGGALGQRSYDVDVLAGQQVAVTLREDDSVTMDVAGEQYQPLRVYWFAWFTFHPETELMR